ncbi:MAG: hypothetical protein KatS3mg027_2482 [Bacteroidia bacterium]|jgi:hypothetical protein|nr:MAG: hypothetical protein KatS3mg027_2482 [Bacteroidia bacterium]
MGLLKNIKILFLKFLFLFYTYYNKGSTKSIAYFSALIALMMVLFLNIFSLLIHFDVIGRNSIIAPMSIKYLIGFIIFMFLFPVMKSIFRERDMLKIKMSKFEMKVGYIVVVMYIILSVLLLIYTIQNKNR